ncbi:MAG TPA: TraR/DksA C4-type zinc finger protein [Devosiaceae bacterium]|nr:TraR/DksA C4-type zinc finger protein [Devosiaceae bacterium]
MPVKDASKYEARLKGRLRELNARLSGVEAQLDQPVDADFEERATEREGDEVLEGLGNAGLSEIRMIQAALGRIEDGTFGDCVACGEPISDARLNAVPHAARCKNCA